MKRRVISGVLAGVLSVGMAATSIPAINVLADNSDMYWLEKDGAKYWYENGVKQGTEGRGKEIFDPSSNAWYWLDAVDDGKMAVSKDVYQDSFAGQWGEREDENGNRFGKWVRYDADGHMVKGWDEKDGNKYYFDLQCGTMAKGDVVIDGEAYHFNEITGILESGALKDDDGNSLAVDGWHKIDGVTYWYENGVRQGFNADDSSYRGKEIYDPATDAWYWLDNVQNGAVAKSKDVFQESEDGYGNIGKWVRYDSEGRMVKGWDEKDGNKYYFDPVYGTMAKGYAKIDGKFYEFDSVTGVLLREINDGWTNEWKNTSEITYTTDGKLSSRTEYSYDEQGRFTAKTVIAGKHYDSDKNIDYAVDENDVYVSEYTTQDYDDNGDVAKEKTTKYFYNTETGNAETSYSEEYNYIDGELDEYIYTVYDNEKETLMSIDKYDENGNLVRNDLYDENGDLSKYTIYEYDGNNREVKSTEYNADNTIITVETNEYDGNGNNVKTEITGADGKLTEYTEYSYNGKNSEGIDYVVEDGVGRKVGKTTVEVNENGDTVSTDYLYDEVKDEFFVDSRTSTTYYHFNVDSYEVTQEKEYDYEIGVWNEETKEYELVYSNGYERSFNDKGILTGHKSYKSNDNGEKVVAYSNVYHFDYELPDAATSESYSIPDYAVTYDANGNQISYTVICYESLEVYSGE